MHKNPISQTVESTINGMIELLIKFEQVFAVWQSGNQPTISKVIPGLFYLQKHLEVCCIFVSTVDQAQFSLKDLLSFSSWERARSLTFFLSLLLDI